MRHIRSWLDDQLRAALDEGKVLATARLTELLRSDSDHVSLDATKLSLAIGGIAPPADGRGINIHLNNNIVPGYVVKLRLAPVTIEGDDHE